MIFVQQLLWDDWNVVHIARHTVSPQEVEEACRSDYLTLVGHTNRVIVIGLTTVGRVLAVVLSPQEPEGVYYVVTAHTASKKERQYYREQKGGASA